MTSIGDSWEEVKNELFSNEEIIEIENNAARMKKLWNRLESQKMKSIQQTIPKLNNHGFIPGQTSSMKHCRGFFFSCSR